MNKISINDFSFRLNSYGCYVVTYTSPKTKTKYCRRTTDMQLIDLTKNAEYPKIIDLNRLKKLCKSKPTFMV